MLYFAYNMRRMIRQQQAGVWEVFTTEEIQGKTLGIVGYGGIGSTAAELARPFGMRIAALRRRPGVCSKRMRWSMRVSRPRNSTT